MRSVFVDTDVYPDLVTDLVAVHVSELLHELIREAGRHYTDFDGADPVAAGVVALIARLLPTMPTAHSSVWLPRVEDPLLQPIAAALDSDPADATSVDEWAAPARPQHAASRALVQTGHRHHVLDLAGVAPGRSARSCCWPRVNR